MPNKSKGIRRSVRRPKWNHNFDEPQKRRIIRARVLPRAKRLVEEKLLPTFSKKLLALGDAAEKRRMTYLEADRQSRRVLYQLAFNEVFRDHPKRVELGKLIENELKMRDLEDSLNDEFNIKFETVNQFIKTIMPRDYEATGDENYFLLSLLVRVSGEFGRKKNGVLTGKLKNDLLEQLRKSRAQTNAMIEQKMGFRQHQLYEAILYIFRRKLEQILRKDNPNPGERN